VQKGYFIGSGTVESGNKTVLRQRLKQAGMRWNVDTAQNLLTLKAKAESGLWHSDVELFVSVSSTDYGARVERPAAARLNSRGA
jgi:hypothetical protein